MSDAVFIHPTADVSPQANIGSGTRIWHQCQIREHTHIGRNCNLGKGVYVDAEVIIGNNVKIQNYVSIFQGVTIEDGVFIGPHVCFTNDNIPRAIKPDGTIKVVEDWTVGSILVKHGASIGANATLLPKVTIGRWAIVGSGTVVTKNVPDYGLVVGNPAHLIGFVCPCGQRLEPGQIQQNIIHAVCSGCHTICDIPLPTWRKVQ
jgi:UDP-2-acetamido-3-amino-2,3-dideoxy-glucuronate N-acetyltransferase